MNIDELVVGNEFDERRFLILDKTRESKSEREREGEKRERERERKREETRARFSSTRARDNNDNNLNKTRRLFARVYYMCLDLKTYVFNF